MVPIAAVQPVAFPFASIPAAAGVPPEQSVGVPMLPIAFGPDHTAIFGLVPDPETVPALAATVVNDVRSSVMVVMTPLAVTTVAIGIVAVVKPEVFESGAQLDAVSRYT